MVKESEGKKAFTSSTISYKSQPLEQSGGWEGTGPARPASTAAPFLQAITEILGRKTGRRPMIACDLLSSLSTFSAFIWCNDSRLMHSFSFSTGKTTSRLALPSSLMRNSAEYNPSIIDLASALTFNITNCLHNGRSKISTVIYTGMQQIRVLNTKSSNTY